MSSKLGGFFDDEKKVMGEPYPELREQKAALRDGINTEEEGFQRTLEQGLEMFERIAAKHGKAIPGSEAFKLHDTFGVPIDLTRELAQARGIQVDEEGFRAAMAAQRDRSRGKITQHLAVAKDLPKS